ADPGEAGLRDRRVDHPLLAEALEHALRHLVGAVVVPDLLAHEEYRGVALHLLDHRLAERLAERERLGVRHTRARGPTPARARATPRRSGRRPGPAPSSR